MATITDQDAGEILRNLYRQGVGKEELKALANLPSKTQFKAACQEIEDFWTGGEAQLKTDVEAALGTSITNALAKKFRRAFFMWKSDK